MRASGGSVAVGPWVEPNQRCLGRVYLEGGCGGVSRTEARVSGKVLGGTWQLSLVAW